MKRLLITIPCERGELFYISSGRRVLLAECNAKLEIYEHATLGGSGVKRIYAALVVCSGAEFTRHVDDAFLEAADGFDLSADIQRKDGIFEAFYFRNMQPEEINIGGEWIFSPNEKQELYRKLLEL